MRLGYDVERLNSAEFQPCKFSAIQTFHVVRQLNKPVFIQVLGKTSEFENKGMK